MPCGRLEITTDPLLFVQQRGEVSVLSPGICRVGCGCLCENLTNLTNVAERMLYHPISRLSLSLALSDSRRLVLGALSYHAGRLPGSCCCVRKLTLPFEERQSGLATLSLGAPSHSCHPSRNPRMVLQREAVANPGPTGQRYKKNKLLYASKFWSGLFHSK